MNAPESSTLQPFLSLLQLEPRLLAFSAQQLAVAQTWASHFAIPARHLPAFALHYLRSTTHTRCWCVPLGESGQIHQPCLARFGNRLQYFDGHLITAHTIKLSHRVHRKPPSPADALRLLRRLPPAEPTPPLLSSYSMQARELAMGLAHEDLGAFALHPSPLGRNNRYFVPRQRFYLSHIGAALKRFCQCLDPGLLHHLRALRCPSASLYNWLSQGNALRRLQAFQAQPVLLPLLVLGHYSPWPHQDLLFHPSPWPCLEPFRPASHEDRSQGAHLMGLAVDAGLPLNDVLAWLLEAPRTAIRYLGQQRVHDTGSALAHFSREGLDSGWDALLAGARLGNRRPYRKAQWQSFIAVWNSVPYWIKNTLDNPQRLFAGLPNDWADPIWTIVATRLADLQDLWELLHRIEHPDASLACQRLRTFAAQATCLQLGNLVDEFHRILTRIRDTLKAEIGLLDSDASTPWPALLTTGDNVPCPHGLHVVELTCPADLEAEHRALRHCIGSYDFRAYQGACRLFSVRDAQGRSLASAEVIRALPQGRVQEKPLRWSRRHLHTQQLRAHENDPPEPAVRQAYELFWKQLKAGALPLNLDWPDMTPTLHRFADNLYQERQALALAYWLLERLERITGTGTVRP
ncbi:hypothetical protein C5U62_32070 [Pseudomonas protegens]|uniref:Uncharacterized protein n=1 Tax=Pseudomonas protegens TaxID=380021 RepID=A0A2T6GB37_9PSED|nr:hypothetical protein [Pseudomonas protegens]PUA41363.1 hypothetical protein C5U62_32070 [Pseudomonas protegens]